MVVGWLNCSPMGVDSNGSIILVINTTLTNRYFMVVAVVLLLLLLLPLPLQLVVAVVVVVFDVERRHSDRPGHSQDACSSCSNSTLHTDRETLLSTVHSHDESLASSAVLPPPYTCPYTHTYTYTQPPFSRVNWNIWRALDGTHSCAMNLFVATLVDSQL